MRISDWSSDVCSSDLTERARHRAADQPARLGDAEMERAVDRVGELRIGGDREEDVARLHRDLIFVEVVILKQLDMVERAFDERLGAGQIGRASCRERVGQYV